MLNITSIPVAVFLDFDGVLTDNFVWIDKDGNELLKFSKYDSTGVAILRDSGIYVHVISSDRNPVVITQRCNKMGIEFSFGVEDKVSEAKDICRLRGFELGECLFIGNDINDLALLSKVGVPVVVADCHSKLLDKGYLQTSARGGNGAVREIADAIVYYKNCIDQKK